MKLEKREITLNEKDSITDAYLMQKTLLQVYVFAAERAEKREIRKRLLLLIEQTCEDLFFVKDLLKDVEREQ
ncbi:MAG: hypothetical protein E7355_01145 [Clostridiales bacterium]|nr:hypothetical protein [Clostridiales bacterium]